MADRWRQDAGANPGLLEFHSKLTTYAVLEEISVRGIEWLALRQRGKKELDRLVALAA